jgi:poly(3-hydroxybutyrate) depolymerase
LTRSNELFGPSRLNLWHFVPDNLNDPAALVVLLPGCNQAAARFAIDSGWIEIASRWRFVLAMETVDHMLARPGLVDAGKVFIVGFSAGGATVAAMLATYPRVFAGGAIIGGLPYGCAKDVVDALSCMMPGKNLAPSEWAQLVREAADPTGQWPRLSIWHGLSDPIVASSNAHELMEQWTEVHGIDQKPDSETSGGKLSSQIFFNDRGKALVELNLIADMKDGVPVDSGTVAAVSQAITSLILVCVSANTLPASGVLLMKCRMRRIRAVCLSGSCSAVAHLNPSDDLD